MGFARVMEVLMEVSNNLSEASFFLAIKGKKIPILQEGIEWASRDTLSPQELINYKIPEDYNVALHCDGIYGAIDIDTKEGSPEETLGILKELKIPLDTYTETTTSGGYHLIYKLPEGSENFNLLLAGKHLGEFRAEIGRAHV
mgnify:CR=1 FL=1